MMKIHFHQNKKISDAKKRAKQLYTILRLFGDNGPCNGDVI